MHNGIADRLLVLQSGDYSAFVKQNYNIDLKKSIENGRKVSDQYSLTPFPKNFKRTEHTKSTALYDWQRSVSLDEIKVI